MPARLVSPVVKLSKQKVITGSIVDVIGTLCSVKLSTRGAVLHGLPFIGSTPAPGDIVSVDYRSGKPIVHTNSTTLENALEEVRQAAVTATQRQPTPPPAPEQTASQTGMHSFTDPTLDPTVNEDADAGYEVTDFWLNEADEKIFMCLDTTNGAAVWRQIYPYIPDPIVRMMTFATEGTLAASIGKIRISNDFGETFTITKVKLSVSTAPTGSTIIVDVNKNDTTLFTTQSNRPAISTSAFSGQSTTIQNNSFADGDYLTFDIDQIGSTIAGAYLTVQIYFE